MERRSAAQQGQSTHLNAVNLDLQQRLNTTQQQNQALEQEIAKLRAPPPPCPECPKKQQAIDDLTASLEASRAEVTQARNVAIAAAAQAESTGKMSQQTQQEMAQLQEQMGSLRSS